MKRVLWCEQNLLNQTLTKAYKTEIECFLESCDCVDMFLEERQRNKASVTKKKEHNIIYVHFLYVFLNFNKQANVICSLLEFSFWKIFNNEDVHFKESNVWDWLGWFY